MKKKITAMLLSVVMAVSLTACGSGSGAGKEKDTNMQKSFLWTIIMMDMHWPPLQMMVVT